MVTKEIKQNVKDCLDRYKKLKQIFLNFCNLCDEMLSKDNFFEMTAKKVDNRQIEIDMLSSTVSLQFSLKKNNEDAWPIGCIDFNKYSKNSPIKLWSLYFNEKGDVFETLDTKFNSANLLSTQGIEAFFYLILDKYMSHNCFKIEDQSYNSKFQDFPSDA
jgi:hypothetical protein